MTEARQRSLRQYKRLPVYIEEDHDEVVPHIHRAIASRHLPMSGIPMVHFDSHPDLLLPLHMQAGHVFDTSQLYHEVSIENWILPLAYAGHISEIFWLKPPWSDQISDRSEQSFFVGEHKDTGEIRLSLDDPYFLTEALYAPESHLINAKQVTLHVITVTPSDWRTETCHAGDSDTRTPSSPCVGPADCVKDVPHEQSELQHNCHISGSVHIQEGSPVCIENSDKPEINMSSTAERKRCVKPSEDLNLPRAKVKKVADQSVETSSPRVKTVDTLHDGSSEKHALDKQLTSNGSLLPLPDQNWLTSLKQKLEGHPYILDIDLDFFSTKDPFQNNGSADQQALLQQLFGFTLPTEKTEKAGLEFCQARQAQLDELAEVFQQLRQHPDSLPKVHDPQRQTLLEKLLELLPQGNSDHPAVDFGMLYRAGCTYDGTALPHHVSSLHQIGQLMDSTADILKALPCPTIVTVSRSSVDDYCPQNQVEMIQGRVMEVLNDIYKDVDVQKLYEQHK